MKRKPLYSLAGILLISICIICAGTKVSRRHRHTKSTNISNNDSCETSPVKQNVTLRGGIKAGYFHKLAQYVAMELCIQLCCQEKGCDVAFMIDKNCYGVKCFSEELCHVVPAKNAPRALMISKVDFRGEVYLQKFMSERLKCFQTSVEHNITLKGGLQAGNFTAVGHVENIDACAKLCCVRENCNLALLVNNHCFMVSCLDKERCKSTPVINQQFRTHVARVNRTKVIVTEQHTVRALSSAPGKTSKLMCKNGVVQYNQTLLGGFDAGKYKLLSHSTNMSACIRLCCGEMTCDVAFMIERKCYGVVCRTLRLCQTIPAKMSVMLNHLSPKISYITSRNEEVNSVILQSKSEICKSNVISYDVTLRGGRHAGKYKAFGPVEDMDECIRVCCMEKFCDLAFMINGTCFTVRCRSEESCQEVRSPGSGFKPMLSYVVREKPRHHKSRGKKLKHKHNHQKGTDKNSNKNSTTSELPHVPSPSLPSVDSEHYCTNSEIMYNVTLRGGVTSGKFRDRGTLPNMQECLRVCCIAKSCDLAFMLGDHCFSITCKNQILCEIVTARSTGYNPRVAYIYARSNITHHEPNLGDEPTHKNNHSNEMLDNKQEHNGNTKHKKEKNREVHKISSSKHKKKPHRTKKTKRRKKHRGKISQSNRAKLKRMYAKERMLLRKLSLLKLRMEMIRRKKYGGDKHTKDNVLLEAFEDQPETSKKFKNKPKALKTSSYKNITSFRSQRKNKTEGSDRNRTLDSMMGQIISKDAKNEIENDGKPFIRNSATISTNTTIFTTKRKQSLFEKGAHQNIFSRKRKIFQNDTFSEEGGSKISPNGNMNTNNSFHSTQGTGSNNIPGYSTKLFPLVKETRLVTNRGNMTVFESIKLQNISLKDMVNRTQDFSLPNLKELKSIRKLGKQNRITVEKVEESSERTNKLSSENENGRNKAVSLEEMISQTTELKNSKSSEIDSKKNKWKNKTFRTKELVGNNNENSNSFKKGTKIIVNTVHNNSNPDLQYKEKTIEATVAKSSLQNTTLKNDSAVSNELINRSQDTAKQQEKRKDLMLLDAFSSGTEDNVQSKRIVKPTEQHSSSPKNFSKDNN